MVISMFLQHCVVHVHQLPPMYKTCARQNAEVFDPYNLGHTQGTKFEIYDRKIGGGGGGRSQRLRDRNQIVTLALEEKVKSPN